MIRRCLFSLWSFGLVFLMTQASFAGKTYQSKRSSTTTKTVNGAKVTTTITTVKKLVESRTSQPNLLRVTITTTTKRTTQVRQPNGATSTSHSTSTSVTTKFIPAKSREAHRRRALRLKRPTVKRPPAFRFRRFKPLKPVKPAWRPRRRFRVIRPKAPRFKLRATRNPSGSLPRTEIQGILRVHNTARRQVGVGPLQWDWKLARYAQAWAEHLATRVQRLKHRPESGPWKQKHGENLASSSSSVPIGSYGAAGSKQWLSEKKYYTYGRVGYVRARGETGHYTQMVWRKSTKIGCGIGRYRRGGWYTVILVCNYSPGGNMHGEKPY